MPDSPSRKATLPPLFAALILSGCFNPAAKQPPNEILCAAEALHQARKAASRAAEDHLRVRADLFTGKLPVEEQQRFWTQIDRLADKRGPQPLVAPATCEALLTAADRQSLSASAAKETVTHRDSGANGQ